MTDNFLLEKTLDDLNKAENQCKPTELHMLTTENW